MKIEKLNKENIKEFIRDLSIDDYNFENNINKLEYYGVKENDTFYMAFEVLPSDDRIAICYINNKLSDSKFLEFINYLNNSLVVKNHLIIQIYDNKFMNILDNNYRCRDIYVSFTKNKNADCNSSFKEKYAEIDMYNIKYLYSKREIVCNLIKQNIQDYDIINSLNEYFMSLDSDIISFSIYDNLYEVFEEFGYKCIYKSYVINDM